MLHRARAGDAADDRRRAPLLGVVALATLVHLACPRYRVAGHGPGGAIGEHLAEILRAVISTAGTALLACVGLVVAVVVATPLRMRDVLHGIGRALARRRSCAARRRPPRSRGSGPTCSARSCPSAAATTMTTRTTRRSRKQDVLEAADDEHGPEPRDHRAHAAVGDRGRRAHRGRQKKKKSPPKTEIDLAPPRPRRERRGVRSQAEVAAPNEADREGHQGARDRRRRRRGRRSSLAPAPAPAAANDGGPLIVEPRFKHADKAEMAAKEKAGRGRAPDVHQARRGRLPAAVDPAAQLRREQRERRSTRPRCSSCRRS